MNSPLIIIAGPTASGKSSVAVELAKRINGAIVSADSMQVYRGMDIGTAKITSDEMQGIRHYMLDVADPKEDFSVALYKELAAGAIREIYDAGEIPILCGGTGFYIQAVLYDIDFTEQDDDQALRQELYRFAGENGAEALHDKLRELDPEAADAIHPNNLKRTIRAIEFYKKSGHPISEHNKEQKERNAAYDFKYFVIAGDRAKLYDKIDERVDKMISGGLVGEVKALLDAGCTSEMTSMQGIGYREIAAYLRGEYSLERVTELVKRNTRHYAKRQLTWFTHVRDVSFIEKEEFGEDPAKVADYMAEECAEILGK